MRRRQRRGRLLGRAARALEAAAGGPAAAPAVAEGAPLPEVRAAAAPAAKIACGRGRARWGKASGAGRGCVVHRHVVRVTCTSVRLAGAGAQ